MKKKKEPQPYFFTNIPKEKLDKLLKGDEDKTMTNEKTKTAGKKKTSSKKTLPPEVLIRMVEDWNDKTISEWAKEFDVSYQTILKMAQAINKEDKTLCPPKPKKARTRADIAKATIALYKKKQGKK